MYHSVRGKLSLRVGSLVVLILALALAIITVGCSSEGNSSSFSAQPLPNLHGQILFVRFGGKFGSETIFTAAANGTHLRRVSDCDGGCCPRFSPMAPAS